MKDKINVAELLRDCPKGMELDCTMFDNVTFERVAHNGIWINYLNDKNYKYEIYLDNEGCLPVASLNITTTKCVIFPKGKTTWEGFHRPFKDGDILVHTQNQRFIMSIYHKRITESLIKTHCILWDEDEGLSINMNICCYSDNTRLATEEEKQKLFDAIKDNGYRWNSETKTLDKLIDPKFNIGDKVKHKCDKNNTVITITGSKNDYYYIQYYNNIKNEYQNEKISFTDQDKYELIIDKFDINTLIPFESRVLVRENKTDVWEPAFYGFFNQHNKRFYTASRGTWLMCIPYNEDTKHLTGTSDECIDFYKNWQ